MYTLSVVYWERVGLLSTEQASGSSQRRTMGQSEMESVFTPRQPPPAPLVHSGLPLSPIQPPTLTIDKK